MKAIKITDLTFGYTQDLVLKQLHLEMEEGEIALLIGENGSGKSTLMKLLLGELKANQGHIQLFGEDLHHKKNFDNIGYVPQMNAMSKIAFPITCLELVVLGLYNQFGWTKLPRKQHYEKAKDILNTMGLQAYHHVPFNELSGGLQQRVMIARAMIHQPRLILFDEPTAGVDQASKDTFFRLIQKLNQDYHLTILCITHEIETAEQNLKIDHIYRIVNGEIKDVRNVKL